ncbi:MAG: glycosyltransferase family 4 protein [Candidatus Omnitrophota bacterium]
MKKILYISHTSEIAGAEKSLLCLLKGLDQKVFTPIVILTGNGPLVEQIKSMNIKTHLYPLANIKKKNLGTVFSYLKTLRWLIKVIKLEKISLIHCNMYISNQYAVIASLFTKVPLVCHIRNIITKPCYYNNFLFLTKTLIANSSATELSYSKYLRNTQKSIVIYNSVSLDESYSTASAGSFREKYGIEKDAFLIGYVGQIKKAKGIHFLIKAMDLLVKQYSQVRLLIAGDISISKESNCFSYLKELSKTLNLEQNIVFSGFINNTRELYSTMDILVLPSEKEPFGRVLIEAMAVGKPVIGTCSGGAPEVVEDGVTGLLVPPGNPEALAKAISEMINNPARAKLFGQKGKERVEKLFNERTNTRQLERIYNQIIVTA